MQKARDVMSLALATCSPDSSVVEAAQLMHNRNIGDVLVMEEGDLKGILTDRDIAMRVVAANHDPRQATVRDYMSTRLVTGKPDWDLKRVADTMGRRQIRRLPIVENGRLLGVVSLGDVALNMESDDRVADSLQNISEPTLPHQASRLASGGLMGGLTLGLLAGMAAALVLAPKPGKELRQQISETKWREAAAKIIDDARERLETLSSALPIGVNNRR